MTAIADLATSLERAKRIVARYDKLLILRLAHLAETLSTEFGERPDRARFVERWSSLERMNARGLLRASRDPQLDRWVSTGEELMRNGIYRRYPDAHPKRHLDGFGRLVLSWSSELPDGTRGVIELAGQSWVDLMFGGAVLIGPGHEAHRTLCWQTSNGGLRIGFSDDDPIMEASLSNSAELAVTRDDWRAFYKPTAASIVVDVWTWPSLQDSGPPDAVALREAVEIVCGGLEEPLRQFVNLTCRSVTSGGTSGRWVAGLFPLTDIGSLRSSALLEPASFDLVNRLVRLGPGSESTTIPRPVLVELARKLTLRWLGHEDSRGGLTRDRWRPLMSRLRETDAGLNLLSELGELEADAQLAGPASVLDQPSVADLVLPLDDATGIGPVVLKKTRSGAGSSVNDFTAVNVLGDLAWPCVEAILSRSLSEAENSEGAAYVAAAAAYVLGRFQTCVGALVQCIGFDADVEEYWHLLAFALRFLERYDEFNSIMFDGNRDARILERLRPPVAKRS